MSVQNSYLLKYTKKTSASKQECPICKKQFSLPAVLTKHLKSQHDMQLLSSPSKSPAKLLSPSGKSPAKLQSLSSKSPAKLQSTSGKSPAKLQSSAGKSPAKPLPGSYRTRKTDAIEEKEQKEDKEKKDEKTDTKTPRGRGRPRKDGSAVKSSSKSYDKQSKSSCTIKERQKLFDGKTSTATKSQSETKKISTPKRAIDKKPRGRISIQSDDTESDSQTEGSARPRRNRREKRAWSPSNDNRSKLEISIKSEPIDLEYETPSRAPIEKESIKIFSCDLCMRSFSTFGGLNRHLRTHDDNTNASPQKSTKTTEERISKSTQKLPNVKNAEVKVVKPPQKEPKVNTPQKEPKVKPPQKEPKVNIVIEKSIEPLIVTEDPSVIHVVVENMEIDASTVEQDNDNKKAKQIEDGTSQLTKGIVNKIEEMEEEDVDDDQADEDYKPDVHVSDDDDEIEEPIDEKLILVRPKKKARRGGRSNMNRTYPCKSCEKVFSKPSHLLRHMTKHTGERPYPCDVCGKGFVSKSNMEKHRVLHSGLKSKVCDECGKAFALSSYLVRHKMLHEKERQEKMGIKPPLESHLCFECGKVFTKALYLKKHIERHVKGKCYECRICGKKFSQRMNRINHELLHNNTKDYECSICNKKFALKCYLKIHLQRHQKAAAEGKINLKRKARESLGQKPFSCDECGKCYSSAKYLSTHMKRHQNPRSYVCETCGKNFLQKINLQRHMLTHTDPATSKNHECKECGKKYSRDIYLDRHVKENHTPEGLAKPRHHCQYCDKTFLKPCLLRIHERTHTKEKPFVCSTCGKGFAQEGYLKIHEEIHAKTKKHECHFCGKSFALLYYLTRHLTRHEQVKSIPCNFPHCTKMFASQKALLEHQRIHSGDLPYKCDLCDKSFPRANSLARHKKLNACAGQGKQRHNYRYFPLDAHVENGTFMYSEEALDNLLETKHFNYLYICSICRQVFTSQEKLDAHAADHCGDEPAAVETVVQEEAISAEAIPVSKEEETIIAEVVSVEEGLLNGQEVTAEETVVDTEWLNKLFSNAQVETGTDGKIIIVVNRD